VTGAPAAAPAIARRQTWGDGSGLGTWVRIAAATGVAYYLGARLGFALTFQPWPVSTLWAPNAILLAAFLLTPVRVWWLILLAALPAHLLVEVGAGVPLAMVLCWFVSNASEALIGAVGVRLFADRPIRFDRVSTVGVFLVFGALLAPFLSSFLDAAFVRINGWGDSPYWSVWGNRFFSNVLAELAVVPVIIAWSGGAAIARRAAKAQRLEAGLLGAGLLVVTLVAFGRQQAGPDSLTALLYLPVPFLLWAAVRFGPRGASTGLLLVILLSTWNTVHGRGPFVSPSPEENALALQLLFIVVGMTVLSFAAAIAERARADALSESENALLEQIARGAHVSEVFARLVAFAESESPGGICSILLLDTDGIHVRHGAAPGLPADYVRAIDGAPIGPRAGACGTAMYRKKVIICRDVRVDPLWADYRELAERHGLRACWSTPILSRQGSVLGSLAVYYDHVRKPGPSERRVVAIATQLASIAIERQRAEIESERQRRELAHMGRAVMLGQLSGALAHELRQPLAAILADAQAGQRMLQRTPDVDPEFAAILADIVAADQRARDVIDGLSVMLGKGKTQRTDLALGDVVRQTLQLARADLVVREVDVDLDAADDVPAVRGDPVQLQQVILNLTLNACEAMSRTPRAKRKLAVVVRRAADGAAELRVSDRGPGIPTQRMERVFEPFVTSKPDGLGLGLSICRSIVRAHGGRLWAANALEGGATFYLILPAAPAADARPDPVARAAAYAD
jgi:two-component system, LuxR family, sensor kinase FixL